ncbi:MAG: hypothetical protein AB7T06_46360 [Kofleriaceae bacterium]
MTRPRIAPDVAAALTAQIPSRLLKKLDAEPELAMKWTWTKATITTDKGETVTLEIESASASAIVRGVSCTCLLQPKCLHVAAVVALLEPADEPALAVDLTDPTASVVAAEVAATAAVTGAAQVAAQVTPADADAPKIAAQAFRILADILATGAETTGAFAQAELLRSIHASRALGLHRLAAAQTRILRLVRELRADRPEFSLSVLAADLREALWVAHVLAAGDSSPAIIGAARRDYEGIGNLRLRGLFTEAVIARTGFAGAVTFLVDDKGTLYTRSDIAPGDASRAAAAYDGSAAIGDAVLPHRELCRAGLFVSDATSSADGRLGAGQRVRAVRASEPSRWTDDAIARRWSTPLADQLARLAAHDATADEHKPAGWDLIFLEGTLLGGSSSGIGLAATNANNTVVLLTTSLDHKALPARDNLAALAKSPSLLVRAITRARLSQPRRLDLLAIGPAPDEPRFPLPDALHGRANLHYDRLSLRPLTAPTVALSISHEPPDDLLSPLRRRIERVVLGGLGTLPMHAMPELDREAALLTDRSLRTGADVLRDLAALAHDTSRAMTGARRPIDRLAFARAWLRAAVYEDAARRRLSVASW